MSKLNKIIDSVDESKSIKQDGKDWSLIKYTGFKKGNTLAQKLAKDLQDHYDSKEEALREIRRYKDNFKRETDYNLLQHGGFPVNNYPTAYKYVTEAGYSDKITAEAAWEYCKRAMGLVVDVLLRDASKVSDSEETSNWADLTFYATSKEMDRFAKKLAFDLQGWKDKDETVKIISTAYNSGDDAWGELILKEDGLPFTQHSVQSRYAKDSGLKYLSGSGEESLHDFTATILEGVVARILEEEDRVELNRVSDSLYSYDEEVDFSTLRRDIPSEELISELIAWIPTQKEKEFVEDYKRAWDVDDDSITTIEGLLEYISAGDILDEYEQWATSYSLEEFTEDYIQIYDLRSDPEYTWEDLMNSSVSRGRIIAAIDTVLPESDLNSIISAVVKNTPNLEDREFESLEELYLSGVDADVILQEFQAQNDEYSEDVITKLGL